jgi:hypothetical protein
MLRRSDRTAGGDGPAPSGNRDQAGVPAGRLPAEGGANRISGGPPRHTSRPHVIRIGRTG